MTTYLSLSISLVFLFLNPNLQAATRYSQQDSTLTQQEIQFPKFSPKKQTRLQTRLQKRLKKWEQKIKQSKGRKKSGNKLGVFSILAGIVGHGLLWLALGLAFGGLYTLVILSLVIGIGTLTLGLVLSIIGTSKSKRQTRPLILSLLGGLISGATLLIFSFFILTR